MDDSDFDDEEMEHVMQFCEQAEEAHELQAPQSDTVTPTSQIYPEIQIDVSKIP